MIASDYFSNVMREEAYRIVREKVRRNGGNDDNGMPVSEKDIGFMVCDELRKMGKQMVRLLSQTITLKEGT